MLLQGTKKDYVQNLNAKGLSENKKISKTSHTLVIKDWIQIKCYLRARERLSTSFPSVLQKV